MNPARSFGPAIVAGDLHAVWLYLVAPLLGAAIGALTYQFIREEQPAAAAAAAVRAPEMKQEAT